MKNGKDKNHFDVVVVGAGISGIGSGYHLQHECPNKSYVILEGRNSIGGTWDLFRYPGIRSDSNMHSLGYNFWPWHGKKSLADGPSILSYVKETAAKYGIDQHIRYHHLVKSASWSSETATWTVEVERKGMGTTETFTCNYLHMCAGYYSYNEGFKPEFAGEGDFKGQVIHPQQWPEDFDATGKKVVVVGSGATAVTLVPSLAETAEHVTMLQRSPTYIVSAPAVDPIARFVCKILPKRWAHKINRRRSIYLERYFYNMSRTKPKKIKDFILKRARKALPEGFDIEKHLTPSYNPWDQRMCLIPDSDLFEAISKGKASIVTEHIDRFTESGIRLKSGEEIPADMIVTATGLKLVVVGEVKFDVDGDSVDFSQEWIYKGLMYSGVPNLSSTFGYINASWTLRADIQAEFMCRLLNYMDDVDMLQATPQLRPSDADMQARPFVENFSSGYIQRVVDVLPKQGGEGCEPWINKQSYKEEKEMLRTSPIDDGVMQFTHPRHEDSDAPRLGHNLDSSSPVVEHTQVV